MLNIARVLEESDEGERRTPSGAIAAGIHRARLAALGLLDEGAGEQDVVQRLTRLSTAIERLQAARAMVQRRA